MPRQLNSYLINLRDRYKRKPAIRGEYRKCYVYYCEDGFGRVKIGSALDPSARIESSRTFCPEAKLLATEVGTQELEYQRQEQFKAYRVSREWFRLEGELLKHVELLQMRDYMTTR